MICEFIDFLANIFIRFFNFILSIDFQYFLNFISSIDFLKILVLVPVYVFVQRVHNLAQQRSLKAISDEIVKINDFVIEFVFKLNTLDKDEKTDDKLLTELLILKSKINSHINYLGEYLYAFPYGGPLKYIVFFFFKSHRRKAKLESDALELEYQEIILNDTILSLEKNIINKRKQLLTYTTNQTQKDILFNNDSKKIYALKDNHTMIHLDQNSIDKMITIGIKLISNLEEDTRKML